MAVFKIMLTSAMLFAVAPFVSTPSHMMAPDAAAAGVSTPATACVGNQSKCHGASTIYKNQTIPDFLLKQLKETDDNMLYAPNNNAFIYENRRYLEV